MEARKEVPFFPDIIFLRFTLSKMAPSPELGGQPKAPDKAGADQPSSNPTTTSEHMPSSLSSSSSSSASASSNSNNPPQSSGTKNAPSAGTTAGTSNSGSSNNYTSSTSSSTGAGGGGAGAIPAAGALAGTLPAQATTPQQDSSKVSAIKSTQKTRRNAPFSGVRFNLFFGILNNLIQHSQKKAIKLS